tara:strand:- start:1998 stop:2450 length:453 start_codon:yes stop_codon:yes gene_type:complete
MKFWWQNKTKKKISQNNTNLDIELTACVLAYEVARSDGLVSSSELDILLNEIAKISTQVKKNKIEILEIIEKYSKNSISFYELIKDINKDYSIQEKLELIEFLWNVSYADSNLDVVEERLIRRIADMINIKDIDVLKHKEIAKKNKFNTQ